MSIEMPLSEVFFESAFKTIEISGSSIKSFYQTKISKTRLKNVSNIEKSTAKIPKTLEDFESFIDDVNAGKVNPYDVMKEGNVSASFDKIEREVLESGNFRLKLEGTREVNVSKSAERAAKKLPPEAKKGYEKELEGLRTGDTRGINDHPLKGDRKGQRAVDIKGTGKGRGAGRVIYEKNADGSIDVIEVLTDHNY